MIALVLVLCAGFFGFWYYRDQIFSKDILKLEILGPETAKVGDEIQYTVSYKNNGNFLLQNPKLTFELPDYSLTEDNKTRLTQDLKDIYPGAQDIVQFKARLLGKEGDIKTARALLSYTPKNLSARYESDTTFVTKMDVVPITLTFDLPSKIEKGKETSYALNYFSNINYPLENLSVKVDSVNGFTVESADPVSLDNIEWRLATLQKAQGGRITIKGLVNGDTGSELDFSAHLGIWINGTFVPIKDASQVLQVISPLLSLSQKINNASDYTATPGENLHYQIFITNTGVTALDNIFVTARLFSPAFDISTLKSLEGSARQSDNSVAFDPKQLQKLRRLEAAQEVEVNFDVKLKDAWTPSNSERNNTVLKNIVNASGISQEFDTKVSSNLQVFQKAYFAPQPSFENSGPVPSEVGSATTYTITWQLKNYLNNVNNVKVRATLPANVTLSAVWPENQISQFSLDSVSRQAVWSAGNVGAGTGVTSPSPSISFQVSLTPALPQRGSFAPLVGPATISGEDQVTGKVISDSSPAVTTALPDDQANGGVVK